MKKVDTTPKKIIIIGAGISGMTSGIYGQKTGFQTEIFERCANVGGLCTSWVRKDFPIDGCIHWMTGTKKGTAIYNMWQDVGAFSDEDIIKDDNFGAIEVDGKKIVWWNNLEKLEKELIEIAPEDKRRIKRLCDKLFLFQNMPLPVDLPVNTMKLSDFIKIGFGMIPYLILYLRATKTPYEKFCSKFKNPTLKKALLHVIPGKYFNAYSVLYAYGTNVMMNGGFPKGGSTQLVNNMAQKYKDLGGKINLCSDVKNIIIRDGKAVGITLKNGEKKYADYVIAACDPFHTKTLLGEKYNFSKFEKRLMDSKKNPLPTCVLISFAADQQVIDSTLETEEHEFFCENFIAGKTTLDSIKIRKYSKDKHFIKNGRVLANVLLPQYDEDYTFWDSFKDKKEYLKTKDSLAETVLQRIESKFPTLKGKLEIIDVVTPKTFNRYTNAFRGAYMPFALTSKNTMLIHNGKVKGIKNLQLSSQWQVTPGGLPVALMTGKFAIQRILKKEKRFYRITKHVKFSYTR